MFSTYGTRHTDKRKIQHAPLISIDEINLSIVNNEVEDIHIVHITEKLDKGSTKEPKLSISNLTLIQNNELEDWMIKYKDVLVEPPEGLPPNRDIEHSIELIPGAVPQMQPPYRHSYKEELELQKQLQELINTSCISPSISPWGAPVLFIKKKDGSLRLCVDYRKLNKLTIKDSFMIPRIDDFLDSLGNAKVFTKLDLHQAYHQVRVWEEDKYKTAFRTKYGIYEFNVLPFGLTNAPATFQRLIQHILRKYLNKFVIAYLDDILIYSESVKEHHKHVELVLECLYKNQLHCKPEKCEFFKNSVEFLGHIVKHNQIKMDPRKLDVIKDWETPKSIKDIRRFHGTCNFYRRFIKDFSKIAAPLNELLKEEEFS
jgi:hypothetical protein